MRKGFTLIELLIVVAIIAILAAIAVPNFLEAQVRAKVSRVKNDLRALNTGIEAYRTDYNNYPPGSDNRNKIPEQITDFLTPFGLDGGFYAFQTRDGALRVGRDFAGLTTPIAYMSNIPTDPFAGQAAGFLTYCYRPSSAVRGKGFVLTSVGPDADLLASTDGLAGVGNRNLTNPLSTRQDTATKKRMGDINERMVIHFIDEVDCPAQYRPEIPNLRRHLEDLTYDPTNGSVSDGDLVRIGP